MKNIAETTDSPMQFDEKDFPTVLGRLAQHYGGITAMARKLGVDPSNLNKACKGLKPPGRKLLKRMGATVGRVYLIPRVEK